jgi:hypothetical protein
MIQVWLTLAVAADLIFAWQPVDVQYVEGATGRPVTVCIDGRYVESTFAGKLVFRDRERSWQSVCAAVRKPIVNGQIFQVRPMRTTKAGGNIARAGNIAARYFDSARTPDQCAGLQLAIWEAIEDGGSQPDFAAGHFRVRATPAALAYAAKYFAASETEGEAIILQTGNTGGQDQISTIT